METSTVYALHASGEAGTLREGVSGRARLKHMQLAWPKRMASALQLKQPIGNGCSDEIGRPIQL